MDKSPAVRLRKLSLQVTRRVHRPLAFLSCRYGLRREGCTDAGGLTVRSRAVKPALVRVIAESFARFILLVLSVSYVQKLLK
jgi:hypothetical protein